MEVAYTTLLLNILDNVLQQVIEESTAHEVWKNLHSLFDKKDLPNKIYIRERILLDLCENPRGVNMV